MKPFDCDVVECPMQQHKPYTGEILIKIGTRTKEQLMEEFSMREAMVRFCQKCKGRADYSPYREAKEKEGIRKHEFPV